MYPRFESAQSDALNEPSEPRRFFDEITATIREQEQVVALEKAALDELRIKNEANLAIGQFEKSYSAAIFEAWYGDSELPDIHALLRGATDLPEDYKAHKASYEEARNSLHNLKRTSNDYVDNKRNMATKKLAVVERSLDYDKIIDAAYSVNGDEVNEEESPLGDALFKASQLIGARKLLESGWGLNYDQIEATEDTVVTPSWWAENDLVAHETGEASVDTGELTDDALLDLEAEILDIIAIGRCYNSSLSDDFKVGTRAALEILQDIRRYSDYSPTPSGLHEERIIYSNAPLKQAVIRKIDTILSRVPAIERTLCTDSESYQAFVSRAKDLQPDKVFDALEISRDPDSRELPVSGDECREYIKAHIPPIVATNLDRIHFRQLTWAEDKDEDTFGFCRRRPGSDRLEIVISDEVMHQLYRTELNQKANDHDTRDAHERAKDVVLSRLGHELGHVLHSTLPLAALKRWMDGVAVEPVFVSSYVQGYFEGHDPRRHGEDFADSFAMFIHDPEALRAASPARFKSMEQIFKDICAKPHPR